MWSNTLSSLQYCKYHYFTGIAIKNRNTKKIKINKIIIIIIIIIMIIIIINN